MKKFLPKRTSPEKRATLQYIQDLKSISEKEVYHFHYSKTAKIPFKVHSFIEIMNCRMLDYCESTILLFENNHVVPAITLLRTTFENSAIIHRIANAVIDVVNNKVVLESLDDLITKIHFGKRNIEDNENILAINILTQLDKLDKQYKDVRKIYDELSEFVHPNWDGVQGSYSELNIDKNKTEIRRIPADSPEIYDWIIACFNISLVIYLDNIKKIEKNMVEFSRICEMNIESKDKKLDQVNK